MSEEFNFSYTNTADKGSSLKSAFWPNDIFLADDSKKYVILGYKINKFKSVVIDVVERDDYMAYIASSNINSGNNANFNNGNSGYNNNYNSASSTTNNNGNNPDKYDKVDKLLLRKLEILGCINFKSKKLNSPTIMYDFNTQLPDLGDEIIMVLFKPPKSWKLEYYSIDPITINIFWNNNPSSVTTKEINFHPQKSNKYSDKLSYHWISSKNKNDYDDGSQIDDMRDVLRIINLTNYVRSKVNPVKNANSLFLNNHQINSLKSFFRPIIMIFTFIYCLVIRNPCYLLNKILTYRFLKLKFKLTYNIDSNSLNNTTHPTFSLVSLLYTFHQINFRIKQFYSLPSQFQLLKFSKLESESSILKGTKFSPSEYIKFYNTVWLIINDILMGYLFSNFLRTHHNLIVSGFQDIVLQYELIFSQTITWLMNNPAGFKLNNELTSFLGQLIFWVLEFWKTTTIRWISINFDSVLTIVEIFTRFFGISIFISISQDFLNILFLNIYGFYIACTRLYYWQLNIVKSLFRLFYGKKYNVLRHRVDSNDYEFDQLLLGIIIFTILVYLLPTVFSFYASFALAKLMILFISTILKFLLISINHFPVVVLLLKLKNQDRLPSGIVLDFKNGVFNLKSKSLTLKEIYTSHLNSMLNYNLTNLNNYLYSYFEDYGYYDNTQQYYDNNDAVGCNTPKNFTTNDVLNSWRNISLVCLVKRLLFGGIINDYDYKKMF